MFYFSSALVSAVVFLLHWFLWGRWYRRRYSDCMKERSKPETRMEENKICFIGKYSDYVSLDRRRSFNWSKILVRICSNKTHFIFLHSGFRFCLFYIDFYQTFPAIRIIFNFDVDEINANISQWDGCPF